MSRWNRKNPIPYGQDPASSEGVNQDLNDLFGAVNTLDDEATSHGDDEEVHLPVIEEGDSGKAAVVNSEETGWEKKSVEDLLNVPAMTAKESIADSDELVMADSEASGGLKKFLWSLAKSTLKSYFDDLYQAVNTAILKSLGTTKGDIIVFTASGAPVRLAVGTNGQVLLANSSASEGIVWGALDENSLPTATGSSLGAIMVGDGLCINSGILCVNKSLSIATKTADYTLALVDAGALVDMNSSNSQQVTVPTDASVAFPVGSQVLIRQKSDHQVAITGADGVTIDKHPDYEAKTAGRYSMIGLVKIDANTWSLVGDLEEAL